MIVPSAIPIRSATIAGRRLQIVWSDGWSGAFDLDVVARPRYHNEYFLESLRAGPSSGLPTRSNADLDLVWPSGLSLGSRVLRVWCKEDDHKHTRTEPTVSGVELDLSHHHWSEYLIRTNNDEAMRNWPRATPFRIKDHELARDHLLKAINAGGTFSRQAAKDYCSRFLIPEAAKLLKDGGKTAERQAFDLFLRGATDYDDYLCASEVGKMLALGKGVAKNPLEARRWLEVAAVPYRSEVIDVMAKVWLAEMYVAGKGQLKQNKKLAGCLYAEIEMHYGPETMAIAQVRNTSLFPKSAAKGWWKFPWLTLLKYVQLRNRDDFKELRRAIKAVAAMPS